MRIRVVIDAELALVAGALAGRPEVERQLLRSVTDCLPGVVECDDGSVYEVMVWDVQPGAKEVGDV